MARNQATLTPEQKDRYLSLFVEEDDNNLEEVGGLFKNQKEAHWWAEEVILYLIFEETGRTFFSINEVLEAA